MPQQRIGAVKQITSHANPIVKEIKGLVAQRKHRSQSGLFVAEGLKLATDALEAGWGVRYLALGPEARDNPVAQKAAATAKARGALILEVSTAVMSAMTRKDNPQMVVGVYEQKILGCRKTSTRPASTLWVALDRVRDPGQPGYDHPDRGCRSVAAGVMLVGDCTDPFAVETVRATMGSLFHVPLARAEQGRVQVHSPEPGPGTVAATHLKGSVDYRTPDYTRAGAAGHGQRAKGAGGRHGRGLPDTDPDPAGRRGRQPEPGGRHGRRAL